MIVMNKNGVDGNTVLKTNEVYEESEVNSQKEVQKKRKKILEKNRERTLMKKIKVIRNIGIAFIISMLLLIRFAIICNLKQEVINNQKQISQINKDNENLKVELLKYDNIEYIEKVATEKLNMVRPTLSSAVYRNIDHKYFNDTKDKKNLHQERKNNLIDIIKSKLF